MSERKSPSAATALPVHGVSSGKKRGAPTIKTRELVDAICTGISLGKSARTMCVETGISQRVLWNWLANDAALMQQYLHAKELCVDAYAEEIIEISDDGSKDTFTDEKGKEVTNREIIARSQLRIDARKWYAARLAPKKYGDKLLNTREDGDTGKPIVHKVEVAFVTMLAAGK
ncbi:hypothetical protein [Nitrosospira sp. NpAV]|uniref:terminase small subunit-like protein n=1 Tax=Nitrosospira sp. NpAV TaxID=58133 RepID=UPI0005A289B5|nr:hypothetical protein [Nitrosospira sp. NpAV]KIO48202.1 hypothetical protein SQ11_13690 [Nitrosospira sp. NpAV]